MFPHKVLLSLSVGLLGLACANAAATQKTDACCMTHKDAVDISNGWAQSISNYSTGLVDALVTTNFTEWTESALSLNSVCLMSPTPSASNADPDLTSAIWTNRTTFELLQGSSAPFEAKILNVWNNCQTAIMRWELTNTGTRPVAGIIVMETVPVRKFFEINLFWILTYAFRLLKLKHTMESPTISRLIRLSMSSITKLGFRTCLMPKPARIRLLGKSLRGTQTLENGKSSRSKV